MPERVRTPAQRWVFEILDRSGSRLEHAEDGVFTYRLNDELGERWKRELLHFTFLKRVAARNGVELAIPGSWLHDQLLGYARERGRVTAVYLAPREDLDRDAVLGKRTVFRERVQTRDVRYGRLLVFTFKVSIYTDPPEEHLVHLAYDCERGRMAARAPSRKALLAGVSDPDEEFGPPPARVAAKKAFRAAWEAVQDDVERRIHSLDGDHRNHVANELKTIDKYYRQLIAEEKRLRNTRATRKGQGESDRRIELLKLEWERRMNEETERLKPQVVVSLAAVAEALLPMERWTCRVEEKGKAGKRDFWLDLARGEAWPAGRRRNGSR